MSRTVTVEELRANLDEVLANVEAGQSITIVREGRSIGTLGPTIVHRDLAPLRDFDWGSPPKGLDIDPAQVIIDERDRERSLKKYGF